MALYLFILLLSGGLLVAVIHVIHNARRNFLRTLGPAAAESLTRLVTPLFDAPPEASTEEAGVVAVVEGRRGGEAIELRVSYASNDGYVNTGRDRYLRAELEVTVGLKGATPKLSLVAKQEAALASFVEQRFEVDVADGLLDDETKAAIMEWVARTVSPRKISVSPKGLTIAIPAASTPTAETKRDIERTLALAERLRQRILTVMEKRATADVRVEAYREGGSEAPRPRPDDEEPPSDALRARGRD